jgi:hypothetical protein
MMSFVAINTSNRESTHDALAKVKVEKQESLPGFFRDFDLSCFRGKKSFSPVYPGWEVGK